MAEPMILELLGNLKTRVATNEVNIANNTSTITANKALFDTHTADDNRHWTTLDRQNFDRVVHFKGYFTSEAKLKESYPTGQVGDYAIVGATDTVWTWDDTTSKWLNTTEQGIVISVNGRTGEVVLTKTDVGLSNVDNTSDVNKPISTAQQAALDDKADRKNITASEVDGFTLRAGVYDLNGVSKTILDFTSSYWTVIVGENSGASNKSATQIWLNYGTNEEPRAYIRHQKANTSWSDFKRLAMNTDIANLQTQITTNTNNIAKNTSDIAQNASNIATNASKIAANTKLITDNKTATDAAIKANSDKIETNKTNIAKNATDIATNKTNIATNTENIATNTTNINNLTNDKADRKTITLSEADSLQNPSGIYTIYNEDKTINGYKDDDWIIIIGDYDNHSKSVVQLWMPYNYSKANAQTTKIFLRRANSASEWGDFVELRTSSQITDTDIATFRHYKGYFEDLISLKTAYATAVDGDYAIVGSAIYVWDSTKNNWVEISGGGSSGTGKWSIRQYDAPNGLIPSGTPYMKDIVGLTLDEQWEVDDDATLLNQTLVDYKVFVIETWINMNVALDWTQTFQCDDGCTIYLNGKLIKAVATVSTNNNVTVPFKKGWNKFQIILREKTAKEQFSFASKITEEAQCLGIDCYHSENEFIEGYVPLVGDSIIEGSLRVVDKVKAKSLEVEDSTLVENLNADLLDGKHASDFASAIDFGTLSEQVGTNTGNILKNMQDIQTNKEGIGTNKDDITNLKSRMTTAESGISTNKTDITNLKTKTDTTNTNLSNLTTRVGTAETDISSLKTKTDTTNTNLSNLSSQVSTNATNIQTNAGDIDALETALGTTNDNVADNTRRIDEIMEGTAEIPTVADAEHAGDSDKLGGQLPAYYAKKTDLNGYLPLTGGTITGLTKVLGTAADNSLMVRGIKGATSDGSAADALYLNYNNNHPVYINGKLAYHEGNIPSASTSQKGIVQLNNTRTSTSTTEAATANALKSAYDTLNTALTTHSNNTTVHLTEADRIILAKANKFKGYYETETALKNAHPTGEAGDYAIVNSTDTMWIWDADKEGGAGWKDGAGKGSVVSVNNMTGEVVLTKSNIGLGNVDNTSDANKPVSTAQQNALNLKVNKAGDTMTGVLKITNNTAAGSSATGALVVTGGIYTSSNIVTQNALYIAHGTPANAKIFLNAKEAINGVDGWLRINDGKAFASGVYFGNGIIRTDGNFQVGNNGQSLNVTSDGVVTSAKSITAGTDLKTKSGIVNYNDKAQVKYNATNECIEFIFS